MSDSSSHTFPRSENDGVLSRAQRSPLTGASPGLVQSLTRCRPRRNANLAEFLPLIFLCEIPQTRRSVGCVRDQEQHAIRNILHLTNPAERYPNPRHVDRRNRCIAPGGGW